MSKKSDWVSASDVGRAKFCPKYLQLKYGGAVVSEAAEKARARGDAAHEQFNTEIKSTDSRCFIASHLYGINDPRTEMLRQFRDRVLMPNILGRFWVSVYYQASPWAVKLCRANSTVDLVIGKLVGCIIKRLEGGGRHV
jgi:hypothetical protein|tara:strand:+ start:18018 stop:18434 length:417 start_codon:yes stop_codon:yes gene_type:complete